MQPNPHFYRQLPKQQLPLASLLLSKRTFTDVPPSWAVVMVDVIGSTQAVAAGLHHDVNLAATGSIVAVLNTLRGLDAQLKVPYFFGGDGATFIVPPTVLDEVLDTLEHYRHHVSKGLSLRLKVGAHSASGVYQDGHTLRIARWAVNEHLTLPVVLGTGVKYAERQIKATQDPGEEEVLSLPTPDLLGMECRWDEIEPPSREQKVLCLVADCPVDKHQARTYAEIARAIDRIFGKHELRQPISGPKLKLDLAVSKIRREMMAHMGHLDFVYLIKHWLLTLIGPLYFRYSTSGRAYLEQVVALSHTLMLDGSFNCVITGTQAQADELESTLDSLERRDLLRYGLHVTRAAVMSCYVVDRATDHAHFVDGTEGGFTAAATVFKAKLRSAASA